MNIIEVKDHSFFINSNFAEFVKDSILETKYSEVGISFEPSLISREFINSVDDKNSVCFACLDEDKIVGILLGKKTSIIFSRTPISEQVYVRVDKNYRGKHIYSMMLEEFYKWSKLCGCVVMVVGFHYHTGVPETIEIYEKKGFKTFHNNYYIEV